MEQSYGGRQATIDERSLLTRAQSGDAGAFAELLEPHRKMLHSLCLRIVGDPHEAEDAVQLTLLAAWQNLDRFEGRAKLSTWLYRIAHNSALSVARKRKAEPGGDVFDDLLSTAPSPERVADIDAVQRALAQLPPDFRAAIVLREFHDMSYADIAEMQGIKIETVKTRINRARQALHRLLSEG